jgi:hypothetical protein
MEESMNDSIKRETKRASDQIKSLPQWLRNLDGGQFSETPAAAERLPINKQSKQDQERK